MPSSLSDTREFHALPVPPTMSGKVALVTGGGVGIGRAIVEQLAAAGVWVAIACNQSVAQADELLRQLKAKGANGAVFPADLTVTADASLLVPRVLEQTGRLDILVNNAGTPIERARLEDCSPELFERVLAANLTSAFLVTRAAIPALRAHGNGAIVNILSLSVQTGGANGAGAYAIAKGGLQVMTRTLARELAPHVRTNAVMPGVIETNHHEVFTTPQRMEQYRQETPLGRNGTAEEVAAAVAFLCSDQARFINGALLDINGGRFLR